MESKNGRTRQIQTSTAKQNLEYHILSTHSEEIAAEKKERDRLAGMVGHSLFREQPNNFLPSEGFFERLRALFVDLYCTSPVTCVLRGPKTPSTVKKCTDEIVANYTCNLEEEKRQSELAAAREEAARLKRQKEVAAMEKKRQKEAEAAAAKAKRAEEAQKRREAEAARRLKQVWPLILYTDFW